MKKNQYKKRSPLKLALFAGLFFCLLGAAVYFAVWSDAFWIKEIDVRPLESNIFTEEIVQKNLEEKLLGVIPQKSIFLVPVEEIKNDILNAFPEIKEVIIQKKLPNILEVEIVKRDPAGIWCQIEEVESETVATSTEEEFAVKSDRKISRCFRIDKEGIIFKETVLIKGSLILNIYSSENKQVGLREQVVALEMMDFILDVRERLPEIKTASGQPLKSNDFEIISTEDLRANLLSGWRVHLNPSYSAESQLRTLEMVLEEEIGKTDSLEYVDLRIEGRVYYK
jgi:hypothetical protein